MGSSVAPDLPRGVDRQMARLIPRWSTCMPTTRSSLPRIAIVTSVFLAAVVHPRLATAQVHDSTAMERRVAQIVTAIGGTAVKFDTLFAPAFLAEVLPAQIRQLTRQLATQFGDHGDAREQEYRAPRPPPRTVSSR